MKRIFLLVTLVVAVFFADAQGTKPVSKPATKPVATNPLKTLNDSASYVIGLSVANFYKQQGITKMNASLVARAINDVLTGKQPLCSDQVANSVMNSYMTKIQSQKSKGAIDSGATFLAQNARKAGVKTTASGLQYEVITEGTGPKPSATDSVTCNYKGTLLNGTVFDNSYDRGEPITFALNRVIPGWTEGLQLMSIGSKYKFYIPYQLAYGASDYGPIPGGSTLTFEVELLNIKKNPSADKPANQ
jgi:FKBP-type peptidyl-prolyl cis-trans isomerase